MTYLIELYVPVWKQVIQTSIYLVFKGWLIYQIFFKQQLSFVELYFCYSSYVFRHLYGNFFFDPQIAEAELVPSASRRMGVEEQILPVLDSGSTPE